MDPNLRIAVIDRNPVRVAILMEGLREAGYTNVIRVEATHSSASQLAALEADVIVVDLASPNRDSLEHMFQVSRSLARPIAMFVDTTDAETTEAAILSGVSAYVVDGLRKERVKPIIEMAISRFNAFARLKAELDDVKSQLEERRLVERAKAILMRMKKIDEPAAYALLRRSAMNSNKRIVDVCQSIVTAAEVLE